MLLVSVIVPVHNGGAAFRRCLEALARARPAPLEIIIVADGETDGAWRDASSFGARVLVSKEARGPAHARNRGAEVAQGDVLLFIDADVEVCPGIIGRVQQLFQNDPDLTAAIGSYDDSPADLRFLSQYRNLLHHFVHQQGEAVTPTFWGACGAVRRDVFMQLGGFDERFARPSIEDVELGYRMTRADHRIAMVKDLQVKHLKRWGAVQMMKVDLFQRAVPWTRLLLGYRRLENNLSLRQSDRLGVILTFVFLGLLAAGPWYPFLFPVAGAAGTLFVACKADFLHFLLNRRGVLFTVGVIPWLLVYSTICGLGLVLGTGWSAYQVLAGDRQGVGTRKGQLRDRNDTSPSIPSRVESVGADYIG